MSKQDLRTYRSTPFFLPSGKGKIFCTFYTPGTEMTASRGILFFPPFAEEMNKSRRIVAEQARRFAGMGCAVVVPDLYGTGDSEGHFGEATWDVWCDDIDHLVAWLRERGVESLHFWGLRLGALLALHCAGKHADILAGMLFWQPVMNGRNYLTQFLRLKVAADLLEASDKTTTGELRNQLGSGCSVEVAGYQLAADLALPIDSLDVTQLPLQNLPGITWLELLPGEDRPVPVVTRKIIGVMRENSLDVAFYTLAGEPFWSLQELVDQPELIETTCRHYKVTE